MEHHGLVFHGILFGNHQSHPPPPRLVQQLFWKGSNNSHLPQWAILFCSSFHSLGNAKSTCPALWTCTENFNLCSAGEFSEKSSRVLGSPLLTCSRQDVFELIQVLVQGRNWVLLWDLQCVAHSEHTVNSCLEEKGIEPPWMAHTTTTVPPSRELPHSCLLHCQAMAFLRVYY